MCVDGARVKGDVNLLEADHSSGTYDRNRYIVHEAILKYLIAYYLPSTELCLLQNRRPRIDFLILIHFAHNMCIVSSCKDAP